eukprot:1650275-Prymnesium_polylepis.1
MGRGAEGGMGRGAEGGRVASGEHLAGHRARWHDREGLPEVGAKRLKEALGDGREQRGGAVAQH